MSHHSQSDPPASAPLDESLACGEHLQVIGASPQPPPAHPQPTVPPRILSGDERALRATGHSQTCIELNRHGAISSCDCRIQPLPNAAVLIGAIVRFVRQHRRGMRGLPTQLTEPLIRHLQAGDPSCQVVANWLVAIGIRDRRILIAMWPRAR